jgi:tetratricopeptide (TPR) repeat protein
MAWNGFFGCLCLWLAFEMPGWTAGQRVQDRCYNEHNEFSAVDSSKACTDLIEGRARLTYLTKADAYVYRAIADESLGDRDHAFADYTQAINLNPKDYYAYLDRGLVSLNAMHLDPAVADFSRANEIRPKSPWPLADRGMAYAWKNDRAHAEADFAAVRAVDPANLVVHHGQGVLDMNDGNLEAAVAEFTAALRQDPHDLWSLQTRADAYQQMGEFQKARADRKMLMQPMKTGNQTSKTQ